MLGQLVRFGLVGGFSSLLYSLIYLALANRLVSPVGASMISFCIVVGLGYVMHSRWSFRGHGRRERGATQAKFVIVQAFGFALTVACTWVTTGPLHWPVWSPLIANWTVIPLATFGLQRYWVFG